MPPSPFDRKGKAKFGRGFANETTKFISDRSSSCSLPAKARKPSRKKQGSFDLEYVDFNSKT